ncbi:MAG: LptF/LptG family permease [Elusimicrobiota bacterium]|jgi:lipopolysaccharide export system permease protein|nr:LptF/LptG family permease [Elusimicrobiota bacterium]
MKILYSYISKKFLTIFVFTAIVFGFIVLISELIRQISFYIEYDAKFLYVIAHLFTKLPWWIIQVLPVATLLSVLFSLGDLAKKNEITAIKAAGVNLWNIIVMFLIIGFFIGIFDLAAREFIVPKTAYYNEVIEKEKIQKKGFSVITEFEDFVVSLDNNVRLSAQYLDTEKKVMEDIVIEDYTDDFRISRLIIAEKAVWEGRSWILINGIEREFENNLWKEIVFERLDSGIHIDPDDLAITKVHFETMTTKQFKRYINQLRLFGYNALKERIALNIRYATVFCHLIVMMIGIPFAFGMNNRFGKIVSFTLALALTFVYWGVQAITQAMGENNMISPFWAAWIPNVIFLALGIRLLHKNVEK